jgi:type IV pilus assembly protein PilF
VTVYLKGIVLLVTLLLSGCVTETTGRMAAEENTEEAAKVNLQLGIAYLRQGDLQAAQVKLEKSAEQAPSDVITQTALGLLYQELGDMPGAEAHFRKAAQLEPKNPDTLNSLAAFICRSDGRSDEALKIFDRALAISLSQSFSNKAMINTNAGSCAKQIDLARAEGYFRAALAQNPNYLEALIQMADVSFQQENYLQSRAFLQRYLSSAEPSSAVLWLGLKLETAMGDTAAAAEFSRRLRNDFPESLETRMLLEQDRDVG